MTVTQTAALPNRVYFVNKTRQCRLVNKSLTAQRAVNSITGCSETGPGHERGLALGSEICGCPFHLFLESTRVHMMDHMKSCGPFEHLNRGLHKMKNIFFLQILFTAILNRTVNLTV